MLADRIADLAEVELMADDTDIPSAGSFNGMYDFARKADAKFESIEKRLHDLAKEMQNMQVKAVEQAASMSKEIEAGRTERVRQIGEMQLSLTDKIGVLTTTITALDGKLSTMGTQLDAKKEVNTVWARVGIAFVIGIATLIGALAGIVSLAAYHGR